MPRFSPSYEPIYKHVVERIKTMIARNYSPGDMLPKYRELAKMLGVGLPAVSKAMRMLAEEGIVKPVRRKGTIVRREMRPRDMMLARIALVFEAPVAGALLRSYIASVCGSIFERAEEYQTDIQLASVHGPHSKARARQIGAAGVQGIVLLGLSREDYLKDFARLKIPVVSADHDTSDFGIPSVICDDDAGAAEMIRHLASLGHRHIAYVERDQRNWQVRGRARREGFALAMKSLQLSAYGPSCRLSAEGKMTPATAKLTDAMGSRKNGPTAVVVDDEVSARALRDILARKKVRIPKQVSLAAAGSQAHQALPRQPDLVRCEFDFAAMGHRAFDLLERRRIAPASSERAVVKVSPTFITGKTTAPPGSSAR